jgi:kynurenine formamidase
VDADGAVTAADFDHLFQRCSNWGRWGDRDTRGALNFIDQPRVVSAASLVRTGTVVSCSRPLASEPAIDNPGLPLHYMTDLPDDLPEGDLTGVAADFLGMECHGEVHSHIDALCHIAYRGRLYNGWPAGSVTVAGASVCHLGELDRGIISRGVLLDVAAVRGVRWLTGGEVIGPQDLDEAEAAAGLSVGTGDIVLLRTGHALRRQVAGPWDSAHEKAGLHPRAMPWLKDREIAALGFDGDGDAAPHACDGIRFPIHVLGITAMGLHFFDALWLEDLAAECARQQRAEFLFAAMPLRADGATGCAINPVAMF